MLVHGCGLSQVMGGRNNKFAQLIVRLRYTFTRALKTALNARLANQSVAR
mgnify:CR=1 FL=1